MIAACEKYRIADKRHALWSLFHMRSVTQLFSKAVHHNTLKVKCCVPADVVMKTKAIAGMGTNTPFGYLNVSTKYHLFLCI